MAKIKVAGKVVELDGDEMTRVIWKDIKDRLILPYLDIDLEYYDLGIENRDATDDQVTIDAAQAIKREHVGVKCATITPRRGTRRGIRPQAHVEVAPTARSATSWAARSSASRSSSRTSPVWFPGGPSRSWWHAMRSATSTRPPISRFPGRGGLTVTFTPEDGSEPIEHVVFDYPGSGVAQVQYNLDDSIRGFRRACFNYGLMRGYPVYLSTKNTILKAYDGRFKDLFAEVFDTEYRQRFEQAGLTYEHRLIDDMVASSLKWHGGYVWACKKLRWRRAVGHRGPGIRIAGTDDLGADDPGRPDGRGRGRPRHRDAPLPPLAAGREDLHQSDRLDLRLDRRPQAPAPKLDGTPEVEHFAVTLERTIIRTVESGRMTKDLGHAHRPRPAVAGHRRVHGCAG